MTRVRKTCPHTLARHLDYAIESVDLLSNESLRKAAMLCFGAQFSLPSSDRVLRWKLRWTIRALYLCDPVRLVKLDHIFDRLESRQLIAQGWTLDA